MVVWFLCAALAVTSTAAQPGPLESGESAAPVANGSTVDRVRELFPQARGWFAIVADARFEPTVTGALEPNNAVLGHARVRQRDGAGNGLVPWLPARFTGAMRIASTRDLSSLYVELRSESGRDVGAQVDQGLVVYRDAYPDTDVLYKATPTHLDEYMLLRTAASSARYVYRVQRGPGIARLRQAGSAVEAVDAQDRAWLRVSAPWAIDRAGQRVSGSVRVAGDRLIVELDLQKLSPPILIDPDWKSTGDMAYGRFYHRVNVLPDGRLLATGGCSAAICSGDLTIGSCRTVVRAAEALDLPTRTFALAGESSEPRYFHVAENLPDGSVLLAGGCTSPTCVVTDSAELLRPADGSVSPIAPLPFAGAGQASVKLDDGRILIAGGCTKDACTSRVVSFDPDTQAFVELASLQRARGRAGVSRLSDGRVLLTGGCTTIQCDEVLASAELYDPRTDAWTSPEPMSVPRAGHYAVAISGGRVLVGGGCAEQSCSQVHASSEIFEPSLDHFHPNAAGLQRRFGAEALRLADGNVLISQGCAARGDCDLSNELFDVGSKQFMALEPAVTTRAFHVLSLTESGIVVANGGCQPGTCSWWNEYYQPKLASTPAARDAGVRDGAAESDAGPPAPDASSGCACSLAAARRGSALGGALGLCVFVAAAVFLSARSRRRHAGAATPGRRQGCNQQSRSGKRVRSESNLVAPRNCDFRQKL